MVLPNKPTCEVEAGVHRLPAGGQPLGFDDEAYYLAYVRNEGGPRRSLVNGIQWLYAGALIGRVCHDRAVDIADGRLQVRDAPKLKPEQYLRRWRRLICEAKPIESIEPGSARPVALIEYQPRAVPLATSHWIAERQPIGGLAALLDRYRETTIPVIAGSSGALEACRVAVDLATPTGAADAWWICDFLRPSRSNPHRLRTAIVFAASAGPLDRTSLPTFNNGADEVLEAPQAADQGALAIC